jgi:hypothetical protein
LRRFRKFRKFPLLVTDRACFENICAGVLMTNIDNAMFALARGVSLFRMGNFRFPLKVGIITAVLMGLQSTKVLTNKRIEFFREASSGYNINAYFVAINITATLEHSTQAVIICGLAP